jgi:hypothetical protein
VQAQILRRHPIEKRQFSSPPFVTPSSATYFNRLGFLLFLLLQVSKHGIGISFTVIVIYNYKTIVP